MQPGRFYHATKVGLAHHQVTIETSKDCVLLLATLLKHYFANAGGHSWDSKQ